jgi:hypothetical protein
MGKRINSCFPKQPWKGVGERAEITVAFLGVSVIIDSPDAALDGRDEFDVDP